MKFIIIPLAILTLFSVVGMAANFSENGFAPIGYSTGDSSGTIYYDYYGTPLIYANGTVITSPTGVVTGANNDEWAYWYNGTYTEGVPITGTVYTMWWDATNTEQLKFSDFGNAVPNQFDLNINLSGSMGYILILTGLILVVSVAGLRVMGIGISDIAVDGILKITAYGGLWASLSVGAYSLIELAAVPMSLGLTFFFILTLIYVIGVINSIGTGTGE